MALFFMIWALFPTSQSFDLLNLKVFKPDVATLHKVGVNYLLCSPLDHTLSLFDAEGNIIKTLDKQGQGPGELDTPTIIAITPDEIIVKSGLRNIHAFDHKLNDLPRKNYPALPYSSVGITYLPSGTFVNKNRFLFFGRHASHMYFDLQLVDDQWQVLPKIPITNKQDGTHVVQHHNHFFVSDVFQDEQAYQIKVYSSLPESEKDTKGLEQILSANIETFPSITYKGIDFPFRSMFRNVAKTSTGYIVEITKNDRNGTVYWDHFDNQGNFKKREEKGDDRLIPVFNSTETFWIKDGETMQPIR